MSAEAVESIDSAPQWLIKVQGLGFRVQGLGFRVQGLGI